MVELERIKPTRENFQNNTPDQKIYEPLTRQRTLELLGVMDITHNFETMKKVKGFENTLKAALDFSAGKFPLLMIYGGVGNGKTRICEAVVIRVFDLGLRVKRDRWSDLVRSMKSHFAGRSEQSYEGFFSDLRSRQALILDDIGSGSTLGSWEWGELEDIIDYRYEHNLFTLVTTNLDIKQFPERILSRFRDRSKARLVLNEAPDQRPEVK